VLDRRRWWVSGPDQGTWGGGAWLEAGCLRIVGVRSVCSAMDGHVTSVERAVWGAVQVCACMIDAPAAVV
jgi:hypothetical protein